MATRQNHWIPSLSSSPDTLEEVLVDVLIDQQWHLVLFNDNHNTFDHVIECLVTTCGHDALQAEQCAMIVHFKGKCTVKSGEYDELAPMLKALSDRDLTVELNP
jgi:ATP-dependent Clp protease adaptor protein ClpS